MVKTGEKETKEPTKKAPGTALAPREEKKDLVGGEVITRAPAEGNQGVSLATRSGNIDKIAAALSAAQSELPTINKTSEVDFFSKKMNARVNYKYANLASVVEAVRPILAKHKLSVTQMPVRTNRAIHVTTLLMHSSGQYLQSTLSMDMLSNDAKEVGTAITYARRYAIAAALNIVTDEDVDAPPGKDEKPDGDPEVNKLCAQLYTVGTKAGGTHDTILAWLCKRYGIKESANELKLPQIKEAIAILQKKADAKKTKRGEPVKKEKKDAKKKETS